MDGCWVKNTGTALRRNLCDQRIIWNPIRQRSPSCEEATQVLFRQVE